MYFEQILSGATSLERHEHSIFKMCICRKICEVNCVLINFARIESLSYCLTFVYPMDAEIMWNSYAVVGPSLNSAREVVMSLYSVGRYADIIVIF